jgi:hypothetical protein
MVSTKQAIAPAPESKSQDKKVAKQPQSGEAGSFVESLAACFLTSHHC